MDEFQNTRAKRKKPNKSGSYCTLFILKIQCVEWQTAVELLPRNLLMRRGKREPGRKGGGALGLIGLYGICIFFVLCMDGTEKSETLIN